MLNSSKLDFWVANNLNVLFIGKHGVGKTSIVIDAFNRNGLKWKYFSASTLDPWVDVIGCPKEMKRDNGSSYLELVRPKDFEDDNIEALFFDEYNRSHKKIRNAVMELIQFKSINGKKFNNLKVVWAAINPDDDDDEAYDVEKLDPAQADRFHVHVTVPYKPVVSYFNSKYGRSAGRAGVEWWSELPADMKNEISPRRLDYALDMFTKKGDLRDVLPAKANISKLIVTLMNGPVREQLEKIYAKKDIEKAQEFIDNDNNYTAAVGPISKNTDYIKFFLPLVSEERLTTLMTKNKTVLKHIIAMVAEVDKFRNVISTILVSGQNKALVRNVNSMMTPDAKQAITGVSWAKHLEILKNTAIDTTQRRKKIYEVMNSEMPFRLTINEAVESLNILCLIASRTQAQTLRRSNTSNRRYYPYATFDNMKKLINRCLACIKNEDSEVSDVQSIVDKYDTKSLWATAFKKIGGGITTNVPSTKKATASTSRGRRRQRRAKPGIA